MDAVNREYGQYIIVTVKGPSLLVDYSSDNYNKDFVNGAMHLLLKAFREKLDNAGAIVLDGSGEFHKETIYNTDPHTDQITVSFRVLEKIDD